MKDPISIRMLIAAVRTLPADPRVRDPKKWYFNQKEHWIGWLSEYHSTGAYRRQTAVRRDAKFAYNHIVEPKMLLYLAHASRVDPKLLHAAKRASSRGRTLMQKSAGIRAIIPWSKVASALWKDYAE